MKHEDRKSNQLSKVNLMDELSAILDGECAYCKQGLPHPAHSRCRQKNSSLTPVSNGAMRAAS
jgi:hypothetical protein